MSRQTVFLRKLTIGLCLGYLLINFSAVLNLALGRRNPAWLVLLATLICFLFSLFHAGQRLGFWPALSFLALCFCISLLFESLGVATGWIYGPYHYTDLLGPKFLGLVPYIIPLAWFMMMYASFLIARSLTPVFKIPWVGLLVCAALAGWIMTAWDLLMDPLMVAGGNWVWEIPGPYFGIPLHNYFGWWFTTFTIVACFLGFWPGQRKQSPGKELLPATWDRWVYLSYLITAAGNGTAAVIVGLTGPALVGFFAMFPWLVWVWWKNSVVSK